MKAEDIRRRLAELALDTNEYRINAGGAMVLHGLREETHDLDIWCTKKLGNALSAALRCAGAPGRHAAVRPRAGRGDL